MRDLFRSVSGGVARSSLNHRLIAPNPPGSCPDLARDSRSILPEDPGGMRAISRGLSAATPPETKRSKHDPGKGRSRFNQGIADGIQFRPWCAAKVIVQPRQPFRCDQRFTVFRAEADVIMEAERGGGHERRSL